MTDATPSNAIVSVIVSGPNPQTSARSQARRRVVGGGEGLVAANGIPPRPAPSSQKGLRLPRASSSFPPCTSIHFWIHPPIPGPFVKGGATTQGEKANRGPRLFACCGRTNRANGPPGARHADDRRRGEGERERDRAAAAGDEGEEMTATYPTVSVHLRGRVQRGTARQQDATRPQEAFFFRSRGRR